ncbi:MAG: hypothetical protein RMX97_31425 [Nostoc sp. DedQUE11]|nr:hypothetical protein [Nostoc sp. DedQUE11]
MRSKTRERSFDWGTSDRLYNFSYALISESAIALNYNLRNYEVGKVSTSNKS